MTYISEKYLYMLFQHYLDSQPLDYWPEVSLYSIPIDILAIDSGEVLTFELKTKDFKRGLAQANRNLAYAEYSYLIVWEEKVTDHLRNRMDDSPIGLISVDEDIEHVSEAEKNQPNRHAKNYAIRQVKS